MATYGNPHQLLILGNGFDLHCGLKSRYSDFFSIRLKPVLNETLSNAASAPYSFYKSGLTVWDLIFSLLGPLKQPSPSVRWCDVEYVMKEVLSHSDAISSKNLAFITVADIYSALKHNKIQRNKHDSVYVSQFLAYKGFQCKSISDLYSVLLSELNMLETAFASYLKKAIKECDRYGIDSKLLLTSLVSSGVGNQITDATILNFNYTHPLLMKQDLDVAEVDYINIHGRCGGEIIFGIDGTGLIYDDRLIPLRRPIELWHPIVWIYVLQFRDHVSRLPVTKGQRLLNSSDILWLRLITHISNRYLIMLIYMVARHRWSFITLHTALQLRRTCRNLS